MNKFLFLILCLTLVYHNSYSQSQQNDIKLTVSALPLFGSSDGFESGINGMVLKPSVGYFISDKTSIDINFSYATLNDLTIAGVDSYYNSFAFIPTLRNNFINKEKWRLFAELGFGLGTIKYDADQSSSRTNKHQDLSGGISILNIGIGTNYFLNDKFGFELIIPYISTRNITSENTNNLYSGIGPTIGFTYVLN
ncbi:outer membrane beta-barrel protein [Mangrovimonas sp. ST2L15]|uniref:outer membrane beta-barrel protein n=1 Tax=Mangrovimonas sp. ST2L15 TaxID=1645916 RepID=UPI0006B428B7|nr:outer membrane beta-barrel protein [Mangrovimonas sp. ST2L15]